MSPARIAAHLDEMRQAALRRYLAEADPAARRTAWRCYCAAAAASQSVGSP